jgi:hypothetical protein
MGASSPELLETISSTTGGTVFKLTLPELGFRLISYTALLFLRERDNVRAVETVVID